MNRLVWLLKNSFQEFWLAEKKFRRKPRVLDKENLGFSFFPFSL
jgi:hypothetical protein